MNSFNNTAIEIIEVPKIVKPKISLDLLEQTIAKTEVEQQTIIHCSFPDPVQIRIWPTTYLIQENGVRKKMIEAFNISKFPYWTYAPNGITFTLLFEGLDKSCNIFDFLEDIPQEGGFFVKGFKRRVMDVYRVEL